MLVSQLSPGHQNDGTNFRNAPGGIFAHRGHGFLEQSYQSKTEEHCLHMQEDKMHMRVLLHFFERQQSVRWMLKCLSIFAHRVMDFLSKVPHQRYESFVPECTLALQIFLARPDFRLSWIILDSKKRVIPLASLAF